MDILIRGLTDSEITYLKQLSQKNKFPSFNQFLLSLCREKIDHGKFNKAESLYLAYLENMNASSNFMVEQTEKQMKQLEEFSNQMEKYSYHIARWLEYEGEVERND